MKNDLEKCSLVVLGRWNPAILSPDWLSKEVFDGQQISILFPVIGGLPPLFEARDIRVAVSVDRVVFYPLRDAMEVLDRIEVAARHILDTLPHTPIAAFGENFSYTLGAFPSQLSEMIDLPDVERLSQHGKTGSVALGRTIELEGRDCRLSLAINSAASDQGNRVEMNFHYDVENARQAAERMRNTFKTNRNHGLEVLDAVYELTLDNEEGNDNQRNE